MLDNSNIAIVKSEKYTYPKNHSFRPSRKYPEYLFNDQISKEDNQIYEMVRNSFILLGYDKSNINLKSWNPLKDFISPGNTVLIKPNMVMDINENKESGVDCLYTHPSVVAAVIDYVLIALKGNGKIIIGDAPMQECNFDNLIKESGYLSLLEFYRDNVRNISIELKDFRELISIQKKNIRYSSVQEKKGKAVALNEESAFFNNNFSEKQIRITNYDPSILLNHHTKNLHEYYINKDVLNADVIINMPKPKTHRKAGVTISLKNMVGINARKEYLPHHTKGALCEGGDEYLNKSILKKFESNLLDKRNYYMQTQKAYKKAALIGEIAAIVSKLNSFYSKDHYKEGSWFGNNTISRTITDLNKIIFYCNKNGIIQHTPQRKYLIIADMIVSGEKEGPIYPSQKEVGIIAVGENPVCFDEIIAKIMGAKLEYISTLKYARDTSSTKLKLVKESQTAFCISNDNRWNNKFLEDLCDDSILYFIPSSGWLSAFKRKN